MNNLKNRTDNLKIKSMSNIDDNIFLLTEEIL